MTKRYYFWIRAEYYDYTPEGPYRYYGPYPNLDDAKRGLTLMREMPKLWDYRKMEIMQVSPDETGQTFIDF